MADRYSGAHLCVTFSTGESALRAAQYDATEILGHIVRIELRSADWRAILDKVVNLCKNTAVALCEGDQPLLLDENEMSMRMPLSSPTAAGLDGNNLFYAEIPFTFFRRTGVCPSTISYLFAPL